MKQLKENMIVSYKTCKEIDMGTLEEKGQYIESLYILKITKDKNESYKDKLKIRSLVSGREYELTRGYFNLLYANDKIVSIEE